jgi:hypothetical protein
LINFDIFGFKKTKHLQNIARVIAKKIESENEYAMYKINYDKFKIKASTLSRSQLSDNDYRRILKNIAIELLKQTVVIVAVDNNIYFIRTKA